jgi:hypothetical protein
MDLAVVGGAPHQEAVYSLLDCTADMVLAVDSLLDCTVDMVLAVDSLLTGVGAGSN